MGYTSSEKEEAVLRIVQGNPSFERSSLATRRINETYAQVSELVQSAFLYEPDSIFYLNYLSSNYYLQRARSTRTLVTELLDYIDDLLKPNHPIDSVAAVNDARRALENIDGALTRSGSISSSAWARYNSAITRSRDEIGKAAKLNYTPRGSSTSVTDVVRPRDEARPLIVSTFRSLKTSHAALVDGIEYLMSAVETFSNSGVATEVARRQVSRAEADLRDLYDTLDALSPEGRVAQARSSLLRILANRAALKRLSEAPTPGAAKLTGGTTYRATASGTGAAPAVTGAVSSPWAIEDGASDVLEVDVGGTTASVDLAPGTGFNPGIQAAQLTSTLAGDFKIGGALATPHPFLTATVTLGSDYDVGGRTFYIVVDGTSHSVTFTPGNKTPAQLAFEIGAAIPDVLPTAYSGGGVEWVEIAYANASPPTSYRNRYMRVITGMSDDAVIPPSPPAPPPNRPMGPMQVDVPSGPVVGYESKGWDANDELWVLANDDQITPTSAHTVVALPQGSWPGYDVTAAAVASAITSAGGSEFEGDTDQGRVVVRSELKGEGSNIRLTSGGLTGTPARATPSHLALETLGFLPDQEDKRSGIWSGTIITALNQNSGFQAVAVASAPRSVLLKGVSAVVTGAAQLEITLLDEDSDPAAGWTLAETRLVINAGHNAGAYGISSTSWNPTTKVLTINVDRDLRDRTATNQHPVTVISELLTVTSKDASTSAYVEVGTPVSSADVALGLSTTRTYGNVLRLYVERNDPSLGWVAADISRLGIRVGDKVVDETGADVATITGIDDAATGYLDVEAVDPLLSLTSGFTVESAAGRDHDAFLDVLEPEYDSLSAYDDDLSRLDRAVAPLLIIDAPARDQVNSAYAVVETYAGVLDDLIAVLGDFVITAVTVVDDALRTMLENGHDRARELLLQSRIGDYFATTSKTASYSQNLMNAASAITVQDINEPTRHRASTDDEFERFMGGWEEDYDPEMDFADEEELPDTPLEDYWPDEV